ncbi:Na+/H+ antiporter [Acrocarpospora phusangensis]|uniref:Na+/H+ antiporter n=1 Tax=Acrocarpospora phusangensis TaxID=1070424 RepID=A0A919QDT9_9ACTN|nr:Na+/H+ antiporter [Acrocarpospora phusangensis]GIH27374.1 Na+/H+ antiporter [Acrocarpospora phusangensis]
MDAISAVQLLLLPAGALAVAGLARRLNLSAPLLLVLAGLVVSVIPGVPEYSLSPEIVLFVFLPPLLYSAALDSSYLRLRDVKRPVMLLSVGLVLFSMLAIGLTAYALIPGLALAAALALGAIVAPPDAVAAAAIGRKLGLPRRPMTVLIGESLFNDATALTAYRVAVGALAGVSAGFLSAAGQFAYAAGVGLLIGMVLAYLASRLLTRIGDALVANAFSLMIPYAAYLAAEVVHASGVISVVVVGIYLGHQMSNTSYGTRLLSRAVWQVVDFLLESIVFALIGLQLLVVVRGLHGQNPWQVAGYAIALFAVTVLSRLAWLVPGTYLPRVVSKKIRSSETQVPWQHVAVVGWAGMRGVVSLAAAFALPKENLPQRDLLLFLTFAVVIGTLVVQGLSFPWLIRKLGVSNEQERFQDDLTEAAAQQAAAAAGLARLEELVAEEGVLEVHQQVVDQLRTRSERAALQAWERLGGGTGPEGEETPATVYRRLRREMLAAERQVFIRLRDQRRIDDEVLRRVMADMDFEEATLERD